MELQVKTVPLFVQTPCRAESSMVGCLAYRVNIEQRLITRCRLTVVFRPNLPASGIAAAEGDVAALDDAGFQTMPTSRRSRMPGARIHRGLRSGRQHAGDQQTLAGQKSHDVFQAVKGGGFWHAGGRA